VLTDLLGVWYTARTHDEAKDLIREQNAQLSSDEYSRLLDDLGKRITNGSERGQFPLRAYEVDRGHAPDAHNTVMEKQAVLHVRLSSRHGIKFHCDRLPSMDAAAILRSQMMLPVLHMASFLGERASLQSMSAKEVTDAVVEHCATIPFGLAFTGHIGSIYSALMARCREAHPSRSSVGVKRRYEEAGHRDTAAAAPSAAKHIAVSAPSGHLHPMDRSLAQGSEGKARASTPPKLQRPVPMPKKPKANKVEHKLFK